MKWGLFNGRTEEPNSPCVSAPWPAEGLPPDAVVERHLRGVRGQRSDTHIGAGELAAGPFEELGVVVDHDRP